MPMARTWNGMTIQDQMLRANGRAIISIGVHAATETKRLTHRISGTLARSVHVAPAGYMPQEDTEQEEAERTDLMMMHLPVASEVSTRIGAVVEMGSWMPYACVEWVGRMHPGVTQGLEAVQGAVADAIVIAAYREEGL